ncbi:hypothetical protein M3226_18970 [Neobacillus cucumis]|uniref:hypothetical protein n=1 Tax=Neobacillus cucumis TaxID=1740721 RepID=UPI0020403CD2|nr:hypothetical protein [Neobacillus cucumis]MCM3727746.1 hypothetical protein [Neobacillus cucumis]
MVVGDSGHGMLVKTFEGDWMLILHHPFSTPESRAKIYEVEETEDSFRVIKARVDLHD